MSERERKALEAQTTAAFERSALERDYLDEHVDRLTQTRDRELAVRSRAAGLVYPGLVFLILVSTQYEDDRPGVIWGVLFFLAVIGLARLFVALRFNAAQQRDSQRAMGILAAVTLISGLAWGLFAGYTIQAYHLTDWTTVIVIVCSAGLLAGSTTTLAIHRSLHITFLLTVFVPLTMSCLVVGGREGVGLALVFVMYCVVLGIEGRNIGEEYWVLLTRTKMLEHSRDQAELASESKSLFLANMSHEIRTPMNAILGMTDIVLGSTLESEQRDHLNMVKSSAETLLAVVDDILDFSKVEAGRLDLDPIPMSLRDTIGDTLKALGVRAQERDLELVLDIDREVPDEVVGDPLRIRQVVVNLVGNAIKFTHDGYIAVRVGLRDRSRGHVVIQTDVADTGVGIARERQDRIFESFTQADPSMTRKYGGTGLGLSISSALVNLMGGRIWLQSDSGAGSTFSFTVRLAVGDDVPTSYAVTLATPPRDLRVLVCDGRRVSRAALAHQLEGMGVETVQMAAVNEGREFAAAAADAGKAFTHFFVDSRLLETDDGPQLGDLVTDPRLGGACVVLMRMGPRRSPHPLRRRSDPPEYKVDPNRLRLASKPMLPSEIAGCLDCAPDPDPDASASGGPDGAEAVAPSVHILLAEDNPVNVLVAERLLQRLGYAVTHAANGTSVVEQARDGAFDLILMDLHMPELDGFEATAAIRAHEQEHGGHVPIVALTARVMGDDEERCREAGMDGYATKPIRPDELRTVIERLLVRS